MILTPPHSGTVKRRYLAPEVVQSSAMDCGPASLKCLLEGFGVPVSYGRLREACQTDVDGTCIDTLEEVAVALGLEAEQVILPPDQLLLASARAVPALVVVRLPDGNTHFVVLWRQHRGLVQLMDPARGRRFLTPTRFRHDLYIHSMAVPTEAWREWAGSDDSLGPLGERLAELRFAQAAREELLGQAVSDPGWHGLATLDAGLRMVAAVVRVGGLRRGTQAHRALVHLLDMAHRRRDEDVIPKPYWSVQPCSSEGREPAHAQEQLLLRGAVLVRVRGLTRDKTDARQEPAEADKEAQSLPPELEAALNEPPVRPFRHLFGLMRTEERWQVPVLLGALCVAVAGVLIEALVFRGLLEMGREVGLYSQRLTLATAFVIGAMALALLELPVVTGALRLGRRMEARLRIAFLEKLPRLRDRYLQSRLTSDMATRCHSLHAVRYLPSQAASLARATFDLLLTTVGIIWLDPKSAPLATLVALLAVGLPCIAHPYLVERDLRLRTHGGALSRFYLDALLGLITIRAHGAQRAVRREHEALLVEWMRAGLSLLRGAVAVEIVSALVGFGLAAMLLFGHLERAGETGSFLLLAYWALRLPVLGEQIATMTLQIPAQRNITLRLLEPLGAPEDPHTPRLEPPLGPTAQPHPGDAPAITFDHVDVRVAGHLVLEQIELHIPAGSHVAIVGPSGAGKSTLVGLLLGWNRTAKGTLRIDGSPLTPEGLNALRRQTAWVDPAVQLWNRTLLSNLRYGAAEKGDEGLAAALELAALQEVLRKLPEGLQTPLGEGGALVSGGEGQRVRFARAALRPEVRLVILDEPFRGLDRAMRRHLLRQARSWWRDATLLCITHDVAETAGFEQVVVIENGRIAEQGSPDALANCPGSRWNALFEAEKAVRHDLWSTASWRRWRLENGRLETDNPSGRQR